MDVNPTSNYLTNSVAAAQRFAGQVMSKMQEGIERKPWGQYKSAYGPTRETVTQVISDPAKAVAAATLDALTNETRKDVWHYTNMHRMIGDIGQYVGPRLGLDSTLAGAVVAAGVPVVLSTLSGQTGPITQGLRPAGYKAVAPVSKEKDPTGRTPQSPVLEATMRYAMGQKSQLLPYQDFKQERPDVAPSTYSQYRRYERMKPEAGSLVIVDPESQSFSALGGTIRGTARGLNDPEIRLKGVPVTASAALGTAAGLGTIKALSNVLNPKLDLEGKTLADVATRTISTGEKVAEKLGRYTDPALLATGLVTAGAVAAGAKKLFERAADRRIKKESPVEYLKHKHGSLEQAGAALGQPDARSWQQLVPYIK
jgi:hypothetical protein